MRALGVGEDEEPVQRPLQCPRRAEVVPTELDAPVFMENGSLQAFDEAVRPGVPRLGPRVADLVIGAGRVEGRLELLPVVCQHPRQRPAGRGLARQHDLGQDRRLAGSRELAPDNPRPPIRRGTIARRQLPGVKPILS